MAFLLTGDEKPYCKVHYRITVKISESEESVLHGGEIGILSIKLHSRHKKETKFLQFTQEAILFEPGSEYTYVIAGDDIDGVPYTIEASWNYQTNLLNPLTWRILASPRIYTEFIKVESLEYKTQVKLCPYKGSPIITGSMNIFQSSHCLG